MIPRLICLCLLALAAHAGPCRIEVVEKGSGWPVPLVELRTVNGLRFVSDNAGLVAFDAPEFFGTETWLTVSSHGYEVPKDGFGFRGVRFVPERDGTHRIEVTRTMVAKRLGRLTGAGLFAESQKLGLEAEWQESGVLGCDSLQLAEHRGRLHWAWGDTNFPHYPLGLYDMLGATTALVPFEAEKPPLRPKFDYFRGDNGRPRGICKMPGAGPTWFTGLASVQDAAGEPRLVCCWIKVKGMLEAYEAGLAVWNEEKATFEKVKQLWTQTPESKKLPTLVPDGHPARWTDAAGKPWLLFGDPFPRFRCPDSFEAWLDEKTWEKLDPPKELTGSDGSKVVPHTGSIMLHPARQRWVTVFMQNGGKPSLLGELWYAEADAPTGPWGTAVKVVTHQDYTFYNPHLHPGLSTGNKLIFEGTYTREFSGAKEPTPRWDYNQVLYRLDLDDPALQPAHKP